MSLHPDMDPQELLRAQLPLIERIIGRVCRRSRLIGADADDFASQVKLALIENDYALLRDASGRSSFAAYLTVVIQRMAVDERMRMFGRWQPSAEAKRGGDAGVLAETLISRDGRTIEEALPLVRGVDPAMTRERLEELARRLPVRTGRPRAVDLEATGVDALVSRDSADARAIANERDRVAGRAARAVRRELDALPLEDRMLLRFRFASSMSIADISRILRLPQRPLYRRLESLLARLKQVLKSEGIDAAAVSDLIGSAADLHFGLDRTENGNDAAVEPSGATT